MRNFRLQSSRSLRSDRGSSIRSDPAKRDPGTTGVWLLNVHGSLLPRFRGAAPIQRAIIEGDEETGITIMYMEEGLDTGDMLAKAATPVGRKTGQELHDELAQMGAELLVDTLDHLGELPRVKQDDALSTYAPMISKRRPSGLFANACTSGTNDTGF